MPIDAFGRAPLSSPALCAFAIWLQRISFSVSSSVSRQDAVAEVQSQPVGVALALLEESGYRAARSAAHTVAAKFAIFAPLRGARQRQCGGC